MLQNEFCGQDVGMFVRKNKNRSGSTSVQIIDKTGGKYRVVKSIGVSSDPEEIEILARKAQEIISSFSKNQPPLLNVATSEAKIIKSYLKELSNHSIRTIGPELIFGKLFDHIGFNVVPKEIFRHLVIARLAYPTSKLETIDYLRRYR